MASLVSLVWIIVRKMVSQLGEERDGVPDLPTMSSAADVTARLSRGLTLDKMMMIDDVLHPR